MTRARSQEVLQRIAIIKKAIPSTSRFRCPFRTSSGRTFHLNLHSAIAYNTRHDALAQRQHGGRNAGRRGRNWQPWKENVMPMTSDDVNTEGAEDKIESSKKPTRNAPRRAAAKPKKNAPAKASPAKAATPLRRSTRAQ